MKTSILVAAAVASLSTYAAAAPANYGDDLTNQLAPKYVAPAGAPDPRKPIYLMKHSRVCKTEEGMVASNDLISKANQTGLPPDADSLREMGCTLTSEDIRVAIVGAAAGHEENLRQSMLGYSQIYWKNSDGTFWSGWAMTVGLKNYR